MTKTQQTAQMVKQSFIIKLIPICHVSMTNTHLLSAHWAVNRQLSAFGSGIRWYRMETCMYTDTCDTFTLKAITINTGLYWLLCVLDRCPDRTHGFTQCLHEEPRRKQTTEVTNTSEWRAEM